MSYFEKVYEIVKRFLQEKLQLTVRLQDFWERLKGQKLWVGPS